ncbi:MAG: circularly permuted type 2 ATP-grasp protein, partial [Verrucomicrobiota bacterium]
MFEDYQTGEFYDEMFDKDISLRSWYKPVHDVFTGFSEELIQEKRRSLDRSFLEQGITFTVYSEDEGTERVFPFDPIPRIIPAAEWETIETGLTQRVKALNLFLKDIYHKGEIIREGLIPKELVKSAKHYRPEMEGVDVPHDAYIHILGSDLIRDEDGHYLVLEDNGRCPSGVSYMLENRSAMKRVFPDLYRIMKVQRVDQYPTLLRETLCSVAPHRGVEPVCVLLTPGQYNSAYFEHTFLARQMGIEIVEGQDLFVQNDYVYMHTTQGFVRVDVIYRRIDPHCAAAPSGARGPLNLQRGQTVLRGDGESN